MAASLFAFLEKINAFLWNGPIILLLAATHLFFTFRLFPQRLTFRAIRASVSPQKEKGEKGIHSERFLVSDGSAGHQKKRSRSGRKGKDEVENRE